MSAEGADIHAEGLSVVTRAPSSAPLKRGRSGTGPISSLYALPISLVIQTLCANFCLASLSSGYLVISAPSSPSTSITDSPGEPTSSPTSPRGALIDVFQEKVERSFHLSQQQQLERQHRLLQHQRSRSSLTRSASALQSPYQPPASAAAVSSPGDASSFSFNSPDLLGRGSSFSSSSFLSTDVLSSPSSGTLPLPAV